MEDSRYDEICSSTCDRCKHNVTGLHATNPTCVHCTRVSFHRSDMFEEKEEK